MSPHIEIAWFGIDVRFQGQRDDDGHSLAGRLYSTVEGTARAHADSTADMPITLTCHIDNEQGLGFWDSRGFHVIENAEMQIEDDVYYRMVR